MEELDFTHIDFSQLDPNDYLYGQDINKATKKIKRTDLYELTKKQLKGKNYLEILEGEFNSTNEETILIPYLKHCSILGIVYKESSNKIIEATHIPKGLDQFYFYKELFKDKQPEKLFSVGNLTMPLLIELKNLGIPYYDFHISNQYSKDVIISPLEEKIKIVLEEGFVKEYEL